MPPKKFALPARNAAEELAPRRRIRSKRAALTADEAVEVQEPEVVAEQVEDVVGAEEDAVEEVEDHDAEGDEGDGEGDGEEHEGAADDGRGRGAGAGGENPFQRRLKEAVLAAAGGGAELTWEIAKANLEVASVGTFQAQEKKKCACGQNPLMKVFHLRHSGTGAQVDVGASCAKKFKLLGDIAHGDAASALRNLQRLQRDDHAAIDVAILKLARQNGVLTDAESKILHEEANNFRPRYLALKDILVQGLDFARRTDAEISAFIRAPARFTPAMISSVLRLALLKPNGRMGLLNCLERGQVTEEHVLLGDHWKITKKTSLLASAVSRGLLKEAQLFLTDLNWRGAHTRAAIMECLLIDGADAAQMFKRYLETPESKLDAEIAQCAVKSAPLNDLQVLTVALTYCSEPLDATAATRDCREPCQKFLDAALVRACDVAQVDVVTRILEAGAQAQNGDALLRWCARVEKEGCSEPSAKQLQHGDAVAIAEALVNVGGANPMKAIRRCGLCCLHFAASSGDTPLVEFLLKRGADPWTFTDNASESIQGLRNLGQKWPLEVARASEQDTAAVVGVLQKRMLDEWNLVKADCDGFFTEEAMSAVKSSIRKRQDGAHWTLLQEFADFLTVVRSDPEEAKHMAICKIEERRRLAERMKREEEERKRQQEARERIEEQARKRRAEEMKEMEERQRKHNEEMSARRQEALKNLDLHAVNIKFFKGKHEGEKYLDVAFNDPGYGNYFKENIRDHRFTDLYEAVSQFAFKRYEIEAEQIRRDAATAGGGDAASDEDLNTIMRDCDTVFPRGKQIGEKYVEVVCSDPSYTAWWLTGKKAPGNNNPFGIFASAWKRLDFNRQKFEQMRAGGISVAHEAQTKPASKESAPESKPASASSSTSEPLSSAQRASPAPASAAPPRTQEQGSDTRVADQGTVMQDANDLMNSGKYGGKRFLDVASSDPQYVDWWVDNGPEKPFKRFAAAWKRLGYNRHKFETLLREDLNQSSMQSVQVPLPQARPAVDDAPPQQAELIAESDTDGLYATNDRPAPTQSHAAQSSQSHAGLQLARIPSAPSSPTATRSVRSGPDASSPAPAASRERAVTDQSPIGRVSAGCEPARPQPSDNDACDSDLSDSELLNACYTVEAATKVDRSDNAIPAADSDLSDGELLAACGAVDVPPRQEVHAVVGEAPLLNLQSTFAHASSPDNGSQTVHDVGADLATIERCRRLELKEGKKYQGKTFETVALEIPLYLDFCLKHPTKSGIGENSDFGRFAAAWRRSAHWRESTVVRSTIAAQTVGANAVGMPSPKRSTVAPAPIQLVAEPPVSSTSASRQSASLATAPPVNASSVAPQSLGSNDVGLPSPKRPRIASDPIQAVAALPAAPSYQPSLVVTATSDNASSVAVPSLGSKDVGLPSPKRPRITHLTSTPAVTLQTVSGATLISFGKHKCRSFEDVFRNEPRYCVWARTEQNPSAALQEFILYLNSM